MDWSLLGQRNKESLPMCIELRFLILAGEGLKMYQIGHFDSF